MHLIIKSTAPRTESIERNTNESWKLIAGVFHSYPLFLAAWNGNAFKTNRGYTGCVHGHCHGCVFHHWSYCQLHPCHFGAVVEVCVAAFQAVAYIKKYMKFNLAESNMPKKCTELKTSSSRKKVFKFASYKFKKCWVLKTFTSRNVNLACFSSLG